MIVFVNVEFGSISQWMKPILPCFIHNFNMNTKYPLQVGVLPSKLLQRSTLTVVNDQKSDVSTFTFCGTEAHMKATALIQIAEISGKDDDDKKDLTFASVRKDSPSGFLCYDYTFETPMKKNERRKLACIQLSTDHLEALPKERKHLEAPKVVVTLPEYFVTGYAVKKETTTVVLTTKQDVSMLKGDRKFTQEKQSVTFDEASNVSPYSKDDMQLHVFMNQPLLRAKSVDRDVYLSHWGQARIREVYDIKNHGSAIKGEFSRLDMMLSQETGSKGAALYFKSKIPASAFDIRFRDEIGNISTSNLAKSGPWAALALEPRFPVFGGWATHFIVEYSLPLESVLVQNSGSFTLEIPSLPSIQEIIYEETTTTIHMPEGSKVLGRAKLGSSHTQVESKENTYFSIFPRPVITIKQFNSVTELSSIIQVDYSYSSIFKFEKHALISLTIAAVAILLSVVSSIDLGQGKVKTA